MGVLESGQLKRATPVFCGIWLEESQRHSTTVRLRGPAGLTPWMTRLDHVLCSAANKFFAAQVVESETVSAMCLGLETSAGRMAVGCTRARFLVVPRLPGTLFSCRERRVPFKLGTYGAAAHRAGELQPPNNTAPAPIDEQPASADAELCPPDCRRQHRPARPENEPDKPA